MLPYQLKEPKKTRFSPRITRQQSKVTRDAHTQVSKQTHSKSPPHSSIMANTDTDNDQPSMEDMVRSMFNDMKAQNATMTSLDQTVKDFRAEFNVSHQNILDQLEDMKSKNKTLEDRLTTANERIVTLENLYYDIYKGKQEDIKQKLAYNIIIRGIQEEEGEEMHRIMNEFLGAVGTVSYTNTNGAIRLGRKQSNHVNGAQGGSMIRPIRLCCVSLQQKGDIFRAVRQVQAIPKFAAVRLSNDLNKEDLLVHKEVQLLFDEAVSKPNIQARMRGSKIEINNKIYTRDKFDDLPFGITRETASTVQTDEGIVFKGHCSPYSNLSYYKFSDGLFEYTCVEQYTGYHKATANSQDVLAAKILCEDNPYTIYELTKQVSSSDEWDRHEYDVIKEGVRLKTEQNPDFKRKLLKNKDKKIFEGTYNKKYGCGSTVKEAHQGNFKPKRSFGNRMSQIYTEIVAVLSTQ